ncbi:MAG: hypothetical protein QM784_01895 [Polyangiaceae bacterium]
MNLRVSIVLRLFLFVCCVAVTGFAQNVKVTESARQHFQAGVAYLEEPTGAKYEEAYREFHAAYAESPSYKILNNIGLCALYLERDGEAIDAYERYLAAAPKSEIPADKRAQIDSDLKRLKAGLVTLKLKVTPASATLIDERLAVQGTNLVNRYSVSNGVLTLGIHPGTHRFTVSADGFTSQTWEVDAGPGSKQERDVTLVAVGSAASAATQDAAVSKPAEPATAANRDVTTPPQTQKEKSYTAAYVSAAVTGVFVASATVTGLLALSKKSKLEDLKSGAGGSRRSGRRSQGREAVRAILRHQPRRGGARGGRNDVLLPCGAHERAPRRRLTRGALRSGDFARFRGTCGTGFVLRGFTKMRSPSTRIATVLLSVVTGCSQIIDVPQAFDAKAGAGGDGGESTAGKGSGGKTTTTGGSNGNSTGGTNAPGGSSGTGAPQGGTGGSSESSAGGTAAGSLGGTTGSETTNGGTTNGGTTNGGTTNGGTTNGGTTNGGTTNGGTTFSGPPSIESFTVDYNKVCSGNPAKLRAVFKNGTGTVDGGVGELTSGVDKLTSAITTNATYTLTVTGSEGQKITKSVEVTVLASGKFTATGAPNGILRPNIYQPRAAALMPNGRVLLVTESVNSTWQFEEYDLGAAKFRVLGTATLTHVGQPISLGNGKALIAGHWGTQAEIFDPSTGELSTAAPLSVGRDSAQGVLLPNGKVLLVGGSWGGETVMLDTAELFGLNDGATGAFTLVSMQEGRVSNRTTVLLDGRVLITGGVNWYGPSLNSAEIYDPTLGTNGAFRFTGNLNERRNAHSAVLLESGKVLISGGSNGTPDPVLATAEIFDPTTGKFTATGALNQARAEHEMVLLRNGRVLVYGGESKDSPFLYPEIYNEGTGRFTIPNLSPDPKTRGFVTPLANGVVLIAGVDSTNKPSAELYCP